MDRWLSDAQACMQYAVTPATLASYALRGNLPMRRDNEGAGATYSEEGIARLFRRRGAVASNTLGTLGACRLGGEDFVPERRSHAGSERRGRVRSLVVPTVRDSRLATG